VKGITAQHSGQ